MVSLEIGFSHKKLVRYISLINTQMNLEGLRLRAHLANDGLHYGNGRCYSLEKFVLLISLMDKPVNFLIL